MTKIGKQREIFENAFEKLGGIDQLISWCKESDDNYKEFIKLFVKLVPNIKPDSKQIESQEQFIKMIMLEQEEKQKQLGHPTKLIDIDVIESELQDNQVDK